MAYSQVTLATVRARLQDRYDSTPFWSNEEARLAINEALRVWNALTGFWKSTGTANTSAGSPYVTVPGALTFGTRVTLSNSPLTPTSIFELDNGKPGWEATTGTPKYWAPLGLKKIAIYPIDAAGGTTLTFDGVGVTPVLTADGDYVDIGQEELNTLIGYALHVLSFKMGAEIFKKMKPQFDAFIAAAMERNAQLKASEPFQAALGADFTRDADPSKAKDN